MLLLGSMATAIGASPGVWGSEPQPVMFWDTVDVFSAAQFDTGYWPSPSDPISVRFYLTPTGGVETELYGSSELGWGGLADGVVHHVEGEPGGRFGVTSDVAIGAEIQLDLLGIFSGVIPLVTENVTFEEEVLIDGLLLADSATPSAAVSVDDPDAIPPFAYSFPVIPGVELVASIQVRPNITASTAGISVSTDVGEEPILQVSEEAWSAVPPDPSRPGELGMVSTWNGALDAVLSLVIEPEVSVDTFLGDFSLASFPIPIDLVNVAEVRPSAPVYTVHALPVLEDLATGYDFGVVDVAAVATLELPVENLGDLLLQGIVGIEGDGAFSVWPDSLAALPQDGTGFVVTFAPSEAREHSANLVLVTNDPTRPTVRVPLVGTARGPVIGEPATPGDDDITTPTSFCGCATPAGGRLSPLLLLVLVAFRRSRLPGAASRTSGSPPPR